MKNLLSSGLTADEITALIPENRMGAILPMDNPVWQSIADGEFTRHLVQRIIIEAELGIGAPMPALTDELYTEFSRTGNRLGFERPYFERRRMLGRTAIAALTDRNHIIDYWLPTLVNRLNVILDEESWALPAHVYNPTGRDSRYIDLFSAETAYTLAEICSVFGDALPAVLRTRILDRLRSDIFEPYIDHADAFHFTHDTHNWNAVCHQGVIGAALLMEAHVPTVAAILAISSTRLTHFVEGFTRDGGCTEGPGYWQYGFGRFTALNQLLEAVTAGELSLFHDDDRIPLIAQYPLNIILDGGYVANFSDCASHLEFAPWLMSYLAGRLHLGVLNNVASSTFQRLAEGGTNNGAHGADFFHLARILTIVPPKRASTGFRLTDTYMPDLQILCVHKNDDTGVLWELAAKGGNNAEHHNHNDCGSYLLHIAGTPIVIDLGAPEYTREFFGPTRYSFLAARSAGHSVPLVNGVEQAAGMQYRARVVSCDVISRTISFVVNLTACYPKEALCESLVRQITLDAARGQLIVSDSFVLSSEGTIETAVMVCNAVTETDDGITVEAGDVRVTLTVGLGCVVKSVDELTYRRPGGVETSVKRIMVAPAERTQRGTLQYTIMLAGPSKHPG